MEQYNYMLTTYKNSKNTVLLSNIFDLILRKLDSTKNDKEKKDLYQYLIKKCSDDDDDICESASLALNLQIFVDNKDLMIDLLAALQHEKCNMGIISALNYVLKKNDIKYTLFSKQHPFITILLHSKTKEPCNKIYNTLQSSKNYNEDLRDNYSCIFLYTIIGYDYLLPTSFVNKLWIMLRNNSFRICSTEIFSPLLQISNQKDIERTENYLNYEMHSRSNLHIDEIIIHLLTILVESVKNNLDPSIALQSLLEITNTTDKSNCAENIILILSEVALSLSSIHLDILLKIYSNIINYYEVNRIYLEIFTGVLLKWKLFSYLTENQESLLKVEFIIPKNLDEVAFPNLEENETLLPYLYTNKYLHFTNELSKLFSSTEEHFLEFLNSLDNVPITFLRKFFTVFIGVLKHDVKSTETTLKVLKLCLKLCENYTELTSTVLPVILTKLSKPVEPLVHLELLKTLPKLAVRKENLPPIISTLKIISKHNSNDLKSTILTIFYDLWCVDVTCYQHLQELLFCKDFISLEFNITRTFILKELCVKRPELYVGDVLPYLSNILKESDAGSTLPITFAIEGLTCLIQSDIIKVDTIWTILLQRFENETNISVLKSFFKWISELNVLPTDGLIINSVLMESATLLWKYITEDSTDEILQAAMKAFESFPQEILNKTMPEFYRTNMVIDHFSNLPAKAWLNVLIHRPKPPTSALLTRLIAKEISDYRPYIYQVPANQREPASYTTTLPVHSVLSAVTGYLSRYNQQAPVVLTADDYNTREDKPSTMRECLDILACGYSRPLPPKDWSHLQELVHVREWRSATMVIACHQVGISGSARRLMENYLATVEINEEDFIVLITPLNLKYLSNSIQPSILEPFLQKALTYYMKNTEKLTEFVNSLSNILSDATVLESNKNSIMNITVKTVKSLNVNDELTNIFLPLITKLSPSKWEELNGIHKNNPTSDEDRLKLFFMCKCYLVENSENDDSFQNLDEILDDSEIINMLDEDYLYTSLDALVANKLINKKSIIKWLLELIGKIQVQFADELVISQRILILCTVFIRSVNIMSGYSVFHLVEDCEMSETCVHFGHALQAISREKEWVNHLPLILEWIWYMTEKFSTAKHEPKLNLSQLIYCKLTLQSGLLTLRHEYCFSVNNNWLKYLESSHKIMVQMVNDNENSQD